MDPDPAFFVDLEPDLTPLISVKYIELNWYLVQIGIIPTAVGKFFLRYLFTIVLTKVDIRKDVGIGDYCKNRTYRKFVAMKTLIIEFMFTEPVTERMSLTR